MSIALLSHSGAEGLSLNFDLFNAVSSHIIRKQCLIRNIYIFLLVLLSKVVDCFYYELKFLSQSGICQII